MCMHVGLELNDLDEFIDASDSTASESDSSESDVESDRKRLAAESLFNRTLEQLPVNGFKLIELMLIVRCLQEQLYLSDNIIAMVFLLLSTMFGLGHGMELPTFSAARKRFMNLSPEGSRSFAYCSQRECQQVWNTESGRKGCAHVQSPVKFFVLDVIPQLLNTVARYGWGVAGQSIYLLQCFYQRTENVLSTS